MKYASWMSKNELKDVLKETQNYQKGIIPLIHENNKTYGIDIENTLIIGGPGSGKTQSILLPTIKNIITNNESLIVNDTKETILKETQKLLQEKNYNIIEINFENNNSKNKWNPFDLPTKLYKENKNDESLELIKDIITPIFQDKKQTGDPFWTISCIDLAVGTALYLLENNKKVTLKEIYMTAQTLTKENLKTLDKTKKAYYFLTGILSSPLETKGSILATFNQKITNYITKDITQNIISTTTFDIKKIKTEKTALFITKNTSEISNTLTQILITQILKTIEIYNQKENNLTLLLEDFDEMAPIKNYSKILTNIRNYNINTILTIKGFITLETKYQKEDIELIEMCITNLIYLYSKDLTTLEKISKICGNTSKEEQLITTEELQRLNKFEALIKLPRLNAIKLDLTPKNKK